MAFDPVTPKIAVDIVIRCGRKIVVIERKYPPLGFALPGGFVDVGERLVSAAIREAKEETGIIITEDQMHPLGYLDDPARDPRRHVISFGFQAHVSEAQCAFAKAADDAKSLRWVDIFDYKSEGISLVMHHGKFVTRADRTVMKLYEF